MLTWPELEVLLDVNLTKQEEEVEEDLEYSVLTPNSMTLYLYERSVKLRYDSPEEEEVINNWKKQQRYVHKWKEAAWKKRFVDT